MGQLKFDVFRPGYQHPKAGMEDIVKVCKERGIQVVGYSTLSGWPFLLKPAEDPHVCALAKRYGHSPGQLLLRHALQKGLAVIPSSSTPERLQSNLQVSNGRGTHKVLGRAMRVL